VTFLSASIDTSISKHVFLNLLVTVGHNKYKSGQHVSVSLDHHQVRKS